MVERSRIRLLVGGLASVVLPGLPGCIGPPYDGPPPPRPHYHPDYYYYPYADVYFHLYTGWYFYRDRNVWHRVRRLPPRIHLDPRRRHSLRIPEGKPWRRHDEHRRKYPARPPRRRRNPDADREERERNRRRYDEHRQRDRRSRRR